MRRRGSFLAACFALGCGALLLAGLSACTHSAEAPVRDSDRNEAAAFVPGGKVLWLDRNEVGEVSRQEEDGAVQVRCAGRASESVPRRGLRRQVPAFGGWASGQWALYGDSRVVEVVAVFEDGFVELRGEDGHQGVLPVSRLVSEAEVVAGFHRGDRVVYDEGAAVIEHLFTTGRAQVRRQGAVSEVVSVSALSR